MKGLNARWQGVQMVNGSGPSLRVKAFGIKVFHAKLAILGIAVMFMGGAFVAGCGANEPDTGSPQYTKPQTTLTIAGAGGTTRVLKLVAGAHEQKQATLGFEFLSGSGSSGGVKGVLQGKLHLGAMSRLPKDEEITGGIRYHQFGQDRVVVATSPDLSIGGLTSQQVKDIFLGVITHWSDVGGPDAPISVLVRGEKDSNTKIMRQGMLGDGAFAPGSVTMSSESDTKAAMSTATNTISYLAYSGVRIEDLPLHALALDGREPGDPNSAYPLESRPLGVAYLPENFEKVKPFLDFLISPETQDLLAARGIVPVNGQTLVLNQQ